MVCGYSVYSDAMKTVRIRPCTHQDLKSIIQLDKLWEEENEDVEVLPRQETYLEIENIYVRPEFRNRHAGGDLIERLLDVAEHNGSVIELREIPPSHQFGEYGSTDF